MTGRVIASRIGHLTRGLNNQTPYGQRMERLSNRIFNEVVFQIFYILEFKFLQVIRPTNASSRKTVRVMAAEPLEQRADKHIDYYPNLPMFHYLTKLLRLHGVFFDEHVVWREVQNNLKVLRGKVVNPKPGMFLRLRLILCVTSSF